jgi:hypothetical protein
MQAPQSILNIEARLEIIEGSLEKLCRLVLSHPDIARLGERDKIRLFRPDSDQGNPKEE